MGRIAALLVVCTTLLCATEWTLRIGGMHCIACTLAVKKALLDLPGVQKAKVNFKNESATVSADESVTLRMMQDAVAQTGYTAKAIHP